MEWPTWRWWRSGLAAMALWKMETISSAEAPARRGVRRSTSWSSKRQSRRTAVGREPHPVAAVAVEVAHRADDADSAPGIR